MGSRFPTLRLIFRTTSTSCGTGGRQTVSGAPTGTDFPRGFLRILTRPVGDRCPPEGSSAMLAVRLGARYRRQELFRQHRLGAAAQGGPQTYGLPLGASLHRSLAEGSGTDGGW